MNKKGGGKALRGAKHKHGNKKDDVERVRETSHTVDKCVTDQRGAKHKHGNKKDDMERVRETSHTADKGVTDQDTGEQILASRR